MPTTEHTPFIQNSIKIQIPRKGLQKTKLSVPDHFDQDSLLFVKDKQSDSLSSLTLQNEICHLDMPKVILKRFWLQLHSRRNTVLVNKTPEEDGGYYWLILDFRVKFNEKGKTMAFIVRKILPAKHTIKEIKQLYEKLVSIEKAMGLEVSENYLKLFLKEKGQTLEEFIKENCLLEIQSILSYTS